MVRMGDLTVNFSRSEFACKCGCGLDSIDPSFVWKLQNSRDIVGVPYTITSGCRCQAHNARSGGAPSSAHVPRENYRNVRCADIACSDILTRKRILADVVKRFKHVGIARTFIHVDDDPEKPEGVFLY